jgi:hypothetical protein
LDDQQVNRLASQFGRQWRYAQQIIVTVPIVDFKVIVFPIPKFAKATSKCFKKRSKARFSLSGEPSDAKDLGRSVRASVARCYCGNSARSHKRAAIHLYSVPRNQRPGNIIGLNGVIQHPPAAMTAPGQRTKPLAR